jgi:hypothetical protein
MINPAAFLQGLRFAAAIITVGGELVSAGWRAARGVKDAAEEGEGTNHEKNREQAAGAAKTSESRNAGKRNR